MVEIMPELKRSFFKSRTWMTVMFIFGRALMRGVPAKAFQVYLFRKGDME
jgi:hypothetical protein